MRPSENDGFNIARRKLVSELERKGIYSAGILDALMSVPRHLFVSEALRFRAYEDAALPIGFNQTVTRPSTVARMVQALNLTGKERVLEIGTGSGYQAAVLARLAGHVVSVERIPELHRRSRDILLLELDCRNVTLLHSENFNEITGSYDAVAVAACADEVPGELLEKLNPGGRLILPVESRSGQVIKRIIRREDGSFAGEEYGEALFVPLVR